MRHIALLLAAVVCLAAFPGSAEEDTMNRTLKIAIPGREADVFNYVLALMQLGAEPVVVWDAYDPADFDGLLMPGGADVHPARYGRENIACGYIDEELDGIQFDCLDAFIKAGKPVLGICRGHQLINVYFGGTLIQHIDTAADHVQLDSGEDQAHPSTALPGSFLADIYGEAFPVNSSHHQAVEEPGEGLVIVQHAHDGTVEGMYHESLPVWCVQWHPERMCFDYAREDTVDGSLLIGRWLDAIA